MSAIDRLMDVNYQVERLKEGFVLAVLLALVSTVVQFVLHVNILDFAIWNIFSNGAWSVIGFIFGVWILGNLAAWVYRRVN